MQNHDTTFMHWLHDLLDYANKKDVPVYPSSSTKKLDVTTATDNSVIGSIPTSTANDYTCIAIEASAAFNEWKQVPAPLRGDFVRRLGIAFREEKEMLGRLISFEMGKILQEGLGEVQEIIDVVDFAVGQSRLMHGKTMHSERPKHRMYEQWHPYGITGIVTAFNFPMAVWAWNACIAAVCGNVCIWKPSSKTPLCAVAVQRICEKVQREMNLPAVMQIFIPENREVAQLMVDDTNVPLISFTGSSAVGKQIAVDVANRMGRTILECSGNNAIIATEHANIDLLIRAVVFGAVGTAGQRCTTTRRLIVHESIYDTVTTKLVAAYNQLKVGGPLDPNTHVGPLIDGDAIAKCKDAVEKADFVGCKKLVGSIDQHNYVNPFIIEVNVHDYLQYDCTREEVFAPILYVMKYDDTMGLDEAIRIQNDVTQGLSSAIFTDNLQQAEYFLSCVGSDCGIANVNIGTSGSEVGAGFGGHKDTGHGDEAGPESWKQYMRRQVNVINYSDSLPLAQGIKFDI